MKSSVSLFYRMYCRVFQKGMYFGSFLLPWRKPKVLEGDNGYKEITSLLIEKQINKVLIVTDQTILTLGLLEKLLSELNTKNITYVVYDKIIPNPTIDNVEEALALYMENGCNAIFGFGGGSAIDCAKCVAARAVLPKKSIQDMKGLFKVNKRLPFLVAVPTTAGTGSEATVAAVITDPTNHDKYAINDLSLVPGYAILDASLTAKMPPHITSTTGMDALTHAVEAFIGHSNTKQTKKYALKAVQLIFDNLEKAYKDGEDLRAREQMLKASYYAGVAFTRAYVGNVHAVSHALSGEYSTPHGLGNAVLLPVVLEHYGEAIYPKLAILADAVGLPSNKKSKKKKAEKEKAIAFIREIKAMNKRMKISTTIERTKLTDLDKLAEHAFKEANPLYPVPVIFDKKDFIYCIKKTMKRTKE